MQPFDDAGAEHPVPFTSARWGSLASFGARPTRARRSGTAPAATASSRWSSSGAGARPGGHRRRRERRPASPHFSDQAERYAAGDLDAVTSYDLKFSKPGKYHYLCYLHGKAMSAVVVVRKAGTSYPHTQAEYNAMATKASNADIEHGLNLWADALGAADSHHVFVGAADMRAMVNRFIPGDVVVKVGDSVTFDMARNLFPVPHTITFGPPPSNPFAPTGDPTNYQGGALSSGVILGPGFGPPPNTFTVKFTKAGTYPFVCLLHAGMGMFGQVVVQ